MRLQRAVALVVLTLLASSCAWTGEDVVPRIPQNAQSSKVFAADGSLLYTAHGEQNRVEVRLERIPLVLQHAVIAIEDERFYEHSGVDLQAVVRAIQQNAEEGGVSQGGSTITQQLVKITLLDTGRTVDRKVQEASLAWQLEQSYTKDQILEVYLNTIYFGNGAYGVEAASETYFGHHVDDVTATEAATLAGLVHAPNVDDPIAHPDAALARRNVVVAKMRELGYLGAADATAAEASPLGLAPPSTEQRYPAAHFVEEVKHFILTDTRFGPDQAAREDLLFNGGLRIYTTLDPAMQAAAEAAVGEVLPDPSADPEAALVALEPRTGYVRAMVGGRDYFGSQPAAKCNLATGCNAAHPGRGTGSAFKPFTLAAALTAGIPLTEVLTAPGCIDLSPSTGPWHVCNADPGEGAPGGTNLIEGTVHSFNTLYAQLVLQVGPDKAVAMANKLGITTKLDPFPSATLGSNNVMPIDMADAYATFANRGVHVPPTLVTKVSDAQGNVIYEAPHLQDKALDPGIADEVTSVLEQVIQRGTGTAAQLDRPAAGKTGTGEDYKNAWFCGYTPDLSTAVWVGFPTTEQSMTPPATRITVYGGTWPAQIWQRFMSSVLAGRTAKAFTPATSPTTTAPPTTGTSPTAAPLVTVPNVVGLDPSAASAALAAVGLRPYTYTPSAITDAKVVRQSPAGGTQLASGSTVTIELGPAGSAPASGTVPNVVGLQVDDAVATLRAAGYATTVIRDKEPDGGGDRKGVVWRQSPPAGTAAPVGTVVQVTANPGG